MLLISVAMLTWYFREPVGGVLHSTQRGGLRIISPLESGISTATGPFKDSYDWMAELFSARSDNERLRQEAEQLRTEVVSLRETEAENEHLRQMLNFVNQPSFPGEYTRVPARVIGRASSAWNATVTINSGSDDGVSLGQTVVNGQGLVGQVSAVATNSAQVLLIIDHTSRVEAKLQPGAAAGTVLGGINGLLEMDFVDKDAKAEANDVVITSGTGRLFVKGVPIGVINEVSDREIEYFKRISITPFVDFNKLEEVLVLIPPAGADQVPLVERGNGG
ncbi:MAG TPA: rod shape-determining protein MreC [Actinobacteria bacterium]|nr:rod shape-determining protein MreC [Actinomycetota bacterium]